MNSFISLTLLFIECDKDGICDISPGMKQKSSIRPSSKWTDKRYKHYYIYRALITVNILINIISKISINFFQSAIKAATSETPIYWELNGLNQEDPYLIQFIREKILIPPPGMLDKGITLTL